MADTEMVKELMKIVALGICTIKTCREDKVTAGFKVAIQV